MIATDTIRMEKVREALLPLVATEKGAQGVYQGMTNVCWVPLDYQGHEYVQGMDWNVVLSWSFREAGRYIAEWRDRGENYMTFYCCAREGTVNEEVGRAMRTIGYRPVWSART